MVEEKTKPFQMRVSPEWLAIIDEWRRIQADLPSRAEAIRRLVERGLTFEVQIGEKVETPIGKATVMRLRPALGMVEVATNNGDGHIFSLSDIRKPAEI